MSVDIFCITTRNNGETRDFCEFPTLAKAKAFGAKKMKEIGARVNNVTVYQPRNAPTLHASLTNGRVRWNRSLL